MPCLITSIHDLAVLNEPCRLVRAPAPQEGSLQLGAQRAAGWIVRLPGVHFPVVCDTLTGLVAYHPADNAFLPFRNIMRFAHRYYALRHRLQRPTSKPSRHTRSRLVSAAG